MKKIIYIIVYTLLMCFIFINVSCEDDDSNSLLNWDIYPIMFHFKITNKDSVSLLNDSIKRNFYKERIKITYKGREYKVCEVIDFEDSLRNQSRAYEAVFKGFWLQNYWVHSASKNFIFRFGEFAGDKKYENETFVIDWGNGTSDNIVFNNECVYSKNKKPHIIRSFYLNNVLIQDKGHLCEITHVSNIFDSIFPVSPSMDCLAVEKIEK